MEDDRNPSLHGIVLAGAYPGHDTIDLLAPRPLLPAAQRPLVSYAIRWMADGGVETATICANTAARAVRARLGRYAYGASLDYLEDWHPRGAAGCARDAGLRTTAGTFVVADGTAVPVAELADLLERHRAERAAITAVVAADTAGRLQPSGFYVFDRRALSLVSEEGFQDIKEKLIPSLYAAGETVAIHVAREAAPRVVNADTYLALNQWLVGRASRHRDSPEGFRVLGGTILHESAAVDPTARLLGPVFLGAEVTVGPDATLVGPVSVGPGSTIGAEAVVSRSVLWSECSVGDGAFVDRSMLADRVRVPARDTLISVLKADQIRAEAPSRRPLRAPWTPLVASLGHASHPQG
ncbi:MAG TPA: NDP-sugar synthase [Vicinamibacteria bacterium]|nr:NDP-sugar synthase [Vicinamibacteria bacterium]